MEPSKEPISVRVSQLNSKIVSTKVSETKHNLVSREGLFDALIVLYDECNADCLKKHDTHIASFVNKQRGAINNVKASRVNISDFEVKSVVGRGHFGEVHVVREKQTSDIYAMKTVKKSVFLSNRNSTFEEERNIMACSNSPWITSLQYAFQDMNNLYFVMEYHPGGDLLCLLHRQGGTIPESAASFYIAELVVAINDLHKMGYVHRDIKPDNILLDRCGHVKLADFGSSAKLNLKGLVGEGMPVGTPDYIAPEVLQSMDNKLNRKCVYGISCDYWSIGILAYQMIIGNAPFTGTNTTGTYSKIMNYKNNFKFPSDIVLSQSYISLIKGLINDCNVRLNYEQILKHSLFKNLDFNSLRGQVPPYVPKVDSVDDTSNFLDIPNKKSEPNIDNFKIKSNFSGKNLPFVGFTYTHDLHEYQRGAPILNNVKNERLEELKKELKILQTKVTKNQEVLQEKERLEKKVDEMFINLESLENLRNRLERDLSNSVAECGSLKRTLELERKDRIVLENRALEILKSTKLKWENSEKFKIDSLKLEIAQQVEKIQQLTETNFMLKEQLQHTLKLENKHKTSLDNVQQLNRRSIIGLESRLDKVTADTHSKITDLQNKLSEETHKNIILLNELTQLKSSYSRSEDKLKISENNRNELLIKLESNQQLIRELENKITVIEDTNRAVQLEKNKNRILEEQIVKLKNNEKVESLTRELSMEKEVLSAVKEEVKALKNEQNNSSKNYQITIQELKEMFVKQIEDLKEQLNKKSEEKNQLEIALQESTSKDFNNKLRVQTLEDLVRRLESGVSKLEIGNKDDVLVQQIKCLEQQLVQVHESTALQNQELTQLKTKFWRVEKDLNNAEIDKRIYKREVKEFESQINKLTSEAESLKSQIAEKTKIHESSILQLADMNDELANEIVKLKNAISTKDREIENGKRALNEELENSAQYKLKIKQLQQEIATLTKNSEVWKCQKTELSHKADTLHNENSRLQKEKNLLNDQEKNINSKLQEYQKNYESLRETCTLLESQVMEYENIVESYKSREGLSNTNIDKLVGELDEAKQETQKAKCLINEEISLKLTAEAKNERLLEELDILSKECSSYQEQNENYKVDCQHFLEQLRQLEETVSEQSIALNAYERQISNFKFENKHLKEESSIRLTQLNVLQDSNYQLTQDLSDYKQAVTELKEGFQKLEETSKHQTNFFNERELKNKATMEQHIKLIDHLQSQLTELNKNNKKGFCEKLFKGNKKENLPPSNIALNYREIERMLAKEKEMNKELYEENIKLKTSSMKHDKKSGNVKSSRSCNEPVSPQTKTVLEKLAQSPSELNRKNSVQRMYHNIPHRFQQKICTKSTICAHCSEQIQLGRTEKYCTECQIVAHVNCARSLSKTCGVPKALVNHYSKSIGKSSTVENAIEADIEIINVSSWVKVPVRENTGWEKQYACLTSKTLKFYSQEPTGANVAHIKALKLKESNYRGQVISDPVNSEIGVSVANSDLPFLIKVELIPETTCWPPKNIIIMTLSIEDKVKWLKALQSIFHFEEKKYEGDVILQCDRDLQVNCVVDLNEAKLLGTEKGLYSYIDNTLLHIEGVLKVDQISIVKSINLAVMLIDSNRYVITCDLNHLINLTKCAQCSKPTLKFNFVNVNNMEYFQLLQTSTTTNVKLAVATLKHLVLLNYDYEAFEFKIARILDTAQPTSCVLFNEHSMIVGADKFFEIDLKNWTAEEFLDRADRNLYQIMDCFNVNSFPLAIFKIFNNPIEYLLCYNEYAFFLNEYGQCSRKSEIKWCHLPRAFYYCAPLLYVVQFQGVEIFKIPNKTVDLIDECTSSGETFSNPESIKIKFNSAKYLGNGIKGIYIGLPGEVRYIANERNYQRLSIDINISDEDGNNDESERSSEFSFTSSLVQSLEDNLSDHESETLDSDSHTKKVVKFSQ